MKEPLAIGARVRFNTLFEQNRRGRGETESMIHRRGIVTAVHPGNPPLPAYDVKVLAVNQHIPETRLTYVFDDEVWAIA